jgi:4-amino-4-deoxy-L-arabinose transferase-like glycosyltransferase
LVPLAFVAVQGALQAFHPHPLAQTVESDFPAHLAHAASWRAVFTVDGFYGFGYALVLRLVSLLAPSPFLAAKLIAMAAAGLSLRTVHALARDLAGHRVAFGAQVCLAVNWYFHETALLVGTDQLASLLALVATRAMLAALRQPSLRRMAAAGALVGAAALVRYTTLVLAVAFVLALVWQGAKTRAMRRALVAVLATLAAAAVVGAPQMWLSWRQHGTLFYHTQAQNVWFGMHGGWDWREWPRDRVLSLRDIVREEPRQFVTHWARETALGTARLSAMTVDLFPRYLARRVGGVLPRICDLLTLLAVVAVAASVRRARLRALSPRPGPPSTAAVFLTLVLVGWVLAVGMAFSASRFLLTPWVLCMVGVVAGFHRICVPADGRADLRVRLARVAWLCAAAVNTTAAVWATLRLS